ncbi:MAG TPA: MBOAT family protein [Clostridiales bacterium]|nr:MBOAT family protein [Clostridiales bacterium]
MVFSDLFFLYVFLPLCLIAYFVTKKSKNRNIVLIVFSLIFYAWGEPLCIFILLFSTIVNYFIGLLIEKHYERTGAKLAVALALIFNLGMLIVFKYSDFIVGNINYFTGASIPLPNIALPIGISFYTFQIISYIMDCYWGTVKVQHAYPKFLMYVSLFPQLVAGPIVRYSVIEDEIDNRKITATDIKEGAFRLMVGLAKKVILANNLYAIVNTFFIGNDISNLSVGGTWYTVIVYSMYVYFDFSGYSDMAIGMGRIFGFHFDENFRHPFISKNISEFWQRWHISLGSFFRDYLLYVPILGRPRKYLGLFLVWFCTGMWHGASWNYIIWGLYFGAFIFLELKLGKKRMKKWPVWASHLYSKAVIIIGFGIFCFEDFGQLGQFFLNISGISMITNGSAMFDTITWTSFLNNFFLFAASVMCCLPVLPKLKDFFNSTNKRFATGQILSTVSCCGLLVICTILLVNATNNPFLYFRF